MEKTMLKNLYINQAEIFRRAYHSDVAEHACQILFGNDWKLFRQALHGNNHHTSWYPRFGANIPNLTAQSLTDVSFDIDFSKNTTLYNQTFADVTDQRLHQLHQNYNNKPWMISWSGGIDSTVMVVSVLKNLKPNERKNFVVLCDPGSVWENPQFFQQHILPNFSVVDSTSDNVDDYKNHFYIIEGEPADCIWGSRAVPYLKNFSNQPWSNNFDYLVQSMILSKEAATWLVEVINYNINSVNLPIKTVAQWYWWYNYNFNYLDAFMRKVYRYNRPLDDISKYFINWYHTQEYNYWSIAKNINHSAVTSPELYKHEAKKYVLELFDNAYWSNFKTKAGSTSRIGGRSTKKWISIQNNQSFCYDIENLF
jgi:hypothetical protein